MARRIHPFTVVCSEPGCKESSRFTYSSNKALVESFEFQKYGREAKPWRCVRHAHGNGVLTTDNRKVEWISEPAKPLDKYPNDPYRSFGGHGVLIGPGFYVDGKDFPTGTRVKVTAEIILPNE